MKGIGDFMGNTRYNFTEEAAPPLPIKLLYVSSSAYGRDWISLEHTHYFTELFYVQKGNGRLHAEQEVIPLQKDDFVIINPHVRHTETSLDNTPMEYVILGIEGIRFSFDGQKDYITFSCQNYKEPLMFYFTAMLKEMETKQKHYELICKNLLEMLIIHLIRFTDFQFDVIASSPKINRECSLVKRYIDANYSEDLSLAFLAELVHLNKYYLVHAFTESYGISPMNYLNEKRIGNSRELLATTDYKIAEIARLSGFSSQSYFSQSFRKSCGISAGEYRKAMKRQNAPKSV